MVYGRSSLTVKTALFFSEIGFSDSRIGLFMTLTLAGDVVLGTFLTLIADHVGRRKILFGGSFLMVLTGVVFAYFENFWILLFAALIGVVSATGGDFGPFRSIVSNFSGRTCFCGGAGSVSKLLGHLVHTTARTTPQPYGVGDC